eukprot:122460_1
MINRGCACLRRIDCNLLLRKFNLLHANNEFKSNTLEILGTDNIIADALSRKYKPDPAWDLNTTPTPCATIINHYLNIFWDNVELLIAANNSIKLCDCENNYFCNIQRLQQHRLLY